MTENEIDYDDVGDGEFGLDMGVCAQENKRENVQRVHRDGVCMCRPGFCACVRARVCV